MRIQSAIVAHLQQTSAATYALVGLKVYWAIPVSNPTPPYVVVLKTSHQPLASAMQSHRFPANASIETIAVAKTQEGAADIADAISADLIAIDRAIVPNTSPPTAGAPFVNGITPEDESDLVNEEMRDKNLFAESRSYSVRYDYR